MSDRSVVVFVRSASSSRLLLHLVYVDHLHAHMAGEDQWGAQWVGGGGWVDGWMGDLWLVSFIHTETT